MASERQLSAVLSDFARTMVTDFPIQGILESLVVSIVEMLPVTAAGVTLISPNTNPRYVAASDGAALRYEQLQTELGEGPCLAAYRTGQPVSVADLRTDDRFTKFGPPAIEAGLVAVFTFPLRQGDKVLGALDLYRDAPGLLGGDDMATAQTLADVTAAYLVNAQARADLKEASDRSYELSMHDALTGLPNRILFLERLSHSLMRGRRTGKLVSVLFADLDQFKVVNDLHGHRAGDELLVAVAQRLTASLRPGDTLARMSGDEFVILCEDLDEGSQAEAIGLRILDALSRPFVLSGIEMRISASVGIAFTGRGDTMPEELLQDADVAMYQAKRAGGDHHQIIDLREQQLTAQRASLQRDLRGAAQRGELRADYQPIVHTEDGKVIAVEALLRWDHPTRGPISPLTLIPLAEQAGLIHDIGEWMLDRACADRHRWIAGGGKPSLGLAVNVSGHQLLARTFVATVAEVLARTQTPPELLTLELTESVLINDAERARVVLGELKELGVTLALDDFGTGYSSLSYLQRFPIDVVKVDQIFVADLAANPASRAIVSAVISLAHTLDMGVVTEGVETAEQHRQVTSLGSEACQGFFFAHPMSADKFQLLATEGLAADDLRLPVAAWSG